MEKHPRILFILHLPPPVHGAAMMGKYIHDSELINDSFDCHYINLTTASGLADIGKVGFRKIVCFIRLLRNIYKKVKALRPGLVYVTPNAKGGAFYKDFVVVQLLKAMGCKVVVHYHNKGVAERQGRCLDNWLYRRFFKDIKVILLAEALYQDVRKYVKREDVYICPNGIPDTLNEEPQAERNNQVPHLLFLSNLLESKGVLVLLDALRMLKDKGYSFVCDFVGGETAEIDAVRFQKEVENRGVNTFTFYKGRKYGEEKNECFKKADMFVFPTFYHNECFPLVLLEAMQQGVVCISTKEGGIPDIIDEGETGFMVEKRDAQALATQIGYLLDNPDLCREMGRKGRARFERQFTLERFEERMKEVLGQLC